MKFSIRTALLAVAVLGIVTSGLAMYVLGKPLAAANRGRVTRAQDNVEGEVRRLQAAQPEPSSGSTGRGMTTRSGYINSGDSPDALGLPWPEASAALIDMVAESRRENAIASDHLAVRDGELFVAVGPTSRADRFAWSAYAMSPPRWTPILRIVGGLLAAVALALALAAVFAVMSVRRGADALTRCLAALGRDLSTPVPQPNVRELRAVADGIATLAQDLARTQSELAERERLAILGRVTAGVAHELRNPLAVIKLRIDLLRRNSKVPGELSHELTDMSDEIMRLDRLVNDLLTVAGRRLGEQRDEDLGDLVRRRAELLKPLAAEKQVALAVSGTAASRIDGDAMARLVDNLLKNAIEASPPGRPVTIDVARDGAAVALRCRDEGDGVPAGREAELFEPFFTTKPDGVGLGLALSRAIAAAHGGSLAYSRDGAATVFELRLVGAST